MEEIIKPPVDPRVEPPKQKPVMQEEFAKFQGEVTSALGSILKKLEEQPKLQADSNGVRIAKNEPVDDSGPTSSAQVPPAWRKLADEILGPDFDIELRLPENGGQIFVIHVPKEKSNATQDHWNMHHRDTRSRELGNTGVKGVKDYLVRVRKNLVGSEIKLPYYENPDPRVGIRLT